MWRRVWASSPGQTEETCLVCNADGSMKGAGTGRGQWPAVKCEPAVGTRAFRGSENKLHSSLTIMRGMAQSGSCASPLPGPVCFRN